MRYKINNLLTQNLQCKTDTQTYTYCITKTTTLTSILSYRPEILQYKAEHADIQTMQHQTTIPTHKLQYNTKSSETDILQYKAEILQYKTPSLFNPRLCIPQLPAISSQERIPGRRCHTPPSLPTNKGQQHNSGSLHNPRATALTHRQYHPHTRLALQSIPDMSWTFLWGGYVRQGY